MTSNGNEKASTHEHESTGGLPVKELRVPFYLAEELTCGGDRAVIYLGNRAFTLWITTDGRLELTP